MTPTERGIAELKARAGNCIYSECVSKGKRRRAITRGNCQACDQFFRRNPEAETDATAKGERLPPGKQRLRRMKKR